MIEDNLKEQLKKGKRYLRIIYLLVLPVVFATLIGAFIYTAGNMNIALYKYELCAFIIYYLLTIYLLRSIAGVMLLQCYLCFIAAILTLYSCITLIIQHVPLNSSHVSAINITYPYNWIIAISVILLYLTFMIRKASELDTEYLKSGFKRIKRYNPYNATCIIYPNYTTMKFFVRKKSQALGRSPLHKKLHALFDNVLGYLLVFAYGFIPTAPFTLRGVGNGEPLSWIMLLGGLFFALMFGLGVEMTFAFFLTYRRIEKDIGRPLRPIVK